MKNEDIELRISSFPLHLGTRISKYTSSLKKQQRIEGLELLQKALNIKQFESRSYGLDHIQYNLFGKPYISEEIDYSISYSHKYTVLAFVENGKIGIDIENIRNLNCDDFKFLFSENEWKLIESSELPHSILIKLWNRKEAVSKALGMGLFLDFNSFEVLEDNIKIENQSIYISSKLMENEVWLSVASDKELINF